MKREGFIFLTIMINEEIKKVLAELSETDLRKWCLEKAIEQENRVSPRGTRIDGFDAVSELKTAQIELANAYYIFITTGKTDAKIDTSKVLLSATKLLTRRGFKSYQVKQFNKALREAGILELKEVQNKKGDTVNYWSFTEEGLAYGENKTWLQNKDVTQPLYYEGKFDELLDIAGINK